MNHKLLSGALIALLVLVVLSCAVLFIVYWDSPLEKEENWQWDGVLRTAGRRGPARCGCAEA